MPDDALPTAENVPATPAAASAALPLESAPPPDAALEELKTEVLSAVRGAITGVMNRHQPALPGPDLDFDFSLREVDTGAAELPPDIQQALSEAVAAADAADDIRAEGTPIDDVDLTIEADLQTDTEPALEVLEAPADLVQSSPLVVGPLPLSLVPSSAPGVPVIQIPLPPPPRRQWPAWTTAALLSVTGIAVGAGTATLIIDPNAVATLRDHVGSQLQSLFDSEPSSPVAESAPAGRDTSRPVAVARATRGADAEEAPASVTPVPAQVTAASTPPQAVPPASTGTGVPASELPAPQTEPLEAVVRIASAGDAATFAHRIAKPLGAGAAVLAAGRSSQLEALAALPPQAAVAAAPTGSEIISAATELPEEPAVNTDDSIAATAPAPAAEAVAPEPESVPVPVPLSALARAHAALSKGDVEGARLVLQAESEAGQVEGMLLLARSFDPSYLKAQGLDPGKGERKIAEKLYRAWYDRSVELGLVSASVNIDRLLQAMARAKP
jgi:hypothetical protein